jgi:hypothetical protein
VKLATICAIRRRLWIAQRFERLQRLTRPHGYGACPTDIFAKGA